MMKSVIGSKIGLFHREVHLILKSTRFKLIEDEVGFFMLQRGSQIEQVCVPLVCAHLCHYKRLLREAVTVLVQDISELLYMCKHGCFFVLIRELPVLLVQFRVFDSCRYVDVSLLD